MCIRDSTYFERAAHWSNATAFSILAISGIVMAFGKFFLLPILGGAVFGWITWLLKTAHNFVGPLFVVSLLVVFFTFVRDNWPERIDLLWLRKGGGLFNGEHVPSGRFNAGEKVAFWAGVFGLGLLAVSYTHLDVYKRQRLHHTVTTSAGCAQAHGQRAGAGTGGAGRCGNTLCGLCREHGTVWGM